MKLIENFDKIYKGISLKVRGVKVFLPKDEPRCNPEKFVNVAALDETTLHALGVISAHCGKSELEMLIHLIPVSDVSSLAIDIHNKVKEVIEEYYTDEEIDSVIMYLYKIRNTVNFSTMKLKIGKLKENIDQLDILQKLLVYAFDKAIEYINIKTKG